MTFKFTGNMKTSFKRTFPVILILLLFSISGTCLAQQNSGILKDYKRANKFLRARSKVNHVVFGASWQKDGSVLYRDKRKNGMKFMLANPSAGNKKQAFNSEKLTSAISKTTGDNFHGRFPFIRNFQLSDNKQTLTFDLRGSTYNCDLSGYTCEKQNSSGGVKTPRNSVISPDGKRWCISKTGTFG
jgi:hypothetical protein